MITWLLGLGLAGGSLALLFLPSAIRVLTPVLELAAQALAGYFRAAGHGLKTSNYGSWTLIGTAFVLGLLWTKNACTASYGPPRASLDVPASQSTFVRNQGRGSTTTTPEVVQSAKDVFCYWFGCL